MLPSFFSWYPKGEWSFVTANRNFNIALAALRVIGATDRLADRDYEQLQTFGPLKMMTEAQADGVFYVAKHFTIPLAIFLPAMYGFVASKVTLGFIFLFDNPINDVREMFPRSGLEFFRSDASGVFRQELGLELGDVTSSAIDTFRLVDEEFGKTEIKQFLEQYFDHLDGFLAYILDPVNFQTQKPIHGLVLLTTRHG